MAGLSALAGNSGVAAINCRVYFSLALPNRVHLNQRHASMVHARPILFGCRRQLQRVGILALRTRRQCYLQSIRALRPGHLAR